MKNEQQTAQETAAAKFWTEAKNVIQAIRTSQTATGIEQQAAMKLNSLLKASQEAIEKFSDNLAVNPRYAFEWADSAHHAAAQLENIATAIRYVLEGRSLLESIQSVKDDLTRRVWGNHFSPRSTSISTNAVRLAQHDAAVEFITTTFHG